MTIRITTEDVKVMNNILERLKNPEDHVTDTEGDSFAPLFGNPEAKWMHDFLTKYNTIINESVSERITKRIKDAGQRYFANDNISEFIEVGEREELIDELTEKFNSVLDSLIIDRENDPNSNGTGKRLAKMYVNELMNGRYNSKPNVTAFPNEGTDNYEGMIVIRADIKSLCSHHWQAVSGTAFIGIIPNGKVLGLSKYIRLAQWEARRGTLQEELCSRIANLIKTETGSEHVGVYISARHNCCEQRGVSTHNSLTQTSVLLGGFKDDPKVREEFYHNVQMQVQSKGVI